MPETLICGPEHRDAWNGFAASCPGTDVLQSYEWGELKGSSDWEPIRLALRDGDRIAAGMSMLRRRLPLPHTSIVYASRGPLLSEWTEDLLRDLLAAARDVVRGTGAILLKVDPALADPAAAELLKRNGFQAAGGSDGFGGTQPRCVMTLSLEPSEDELFAAFKPKWRYNVRLAERKGVTVRAAESREDVDVFYELLKVTADRDEFRVRGLDYFRSMWDCLVPRGMGKLFLAELEGLPLSGAFCTLFGPVCCYTYGASSNEHRETMPNYLMQWTMIRWAREAGYTLYDFRGVSPRHVDQEHDRLAGLNRFKAGFGAEFVEYIGEFDLPLSRVLYPLWVKGMPRVRTLLKRR